MNQERRKNSSGANNRLSNVRNDLTMKGKSNLSKGNTHGFVEGAIVRIKLENILTYDSIEFKTGPYLNVIIGPNGTGKSAIVCAICLGLAGKTSWLGRASSPADFVKYGTNKGIIELELHNCDGDNYVIKREISKGKDSKATSLWWVNGRSANQKSVEEMVSRLNIQVGNLVQFLPQEKVADFARMSQQELLENTEKSVISNGCELFELHQKLMEAGRTSQELEQNLATLQEQLETEKQKNSRLEQDVKNFEQREEFLDRVRLLKMKKPWLEYMELKRQFEGLKGERDRKLTAFKKAQTEHAPLRRRLEKMNEQKQNLDAHLKRKTAEIRDHANKVSESSRDLENLADKISEAKNELECKQKEEENRKNRLADLINQLNALEAAFAKIEGANTEQMAAEQLHVSEKMRDVMRQMSVIDQTGLTIQSEINNLRREIQDAQNELRNIQDIGNHRLEQLRRNHKHTYDAVMWLRKNKDKFKGVIHEPILLCLNMKNPNNAKYFENHIPISDLRAFICENPDDLDLFLTIVRDQQKLKVNAVKVPDQPLSSFKPRYPIETIRHFGFHSYLRDLFTCPDDVMAYLCLLYKVHLIPVGDASSRKNVENIIKHHPEINMFYTVDVQYSIKKSKYDGSVSSRNTPLRPGNFLAASVDVQREQALTRQIQELQKRKADKENEYGVLQRQSAELEKELNVWREKKRDLTRQKDEKKRIQQQIQMKKESVRRVETEEVDLAAEERKMQAKVSTIISKKCEHLAAMHSHTQRCFLLSKEKVHSSLQQSEILRECIVLESQLRDQSQGLHILERELEEVKKNVKEMKRRAKEKLEEAKKTTKTSASEELSADLRQAFERCPSTIQELDAEIHQLQARADSIFQTNPNVIKEYKVREQRIQELKSKLEQKTSEQALHTTEVEEAHNQWLNPLKALISKVNHNFSFFFSAMDCCGEVDLTIPENQTFYDKYGVRIKVKFRDGETLRELTPHHQSGGERSVATVLYMMAVQELAKCPFRCVDEINQGMDPINERKVFQLVVQTVCKRSVSQYFLLTPKLLPDLEYDDNMTVLCVNNGPHVMNHSHWKLREFLRRRAAVDE